MFDSLQPVIVEGDPIIRRTDHARAFFHFGKTIAASTGRHLAHLIPASVAVAVSLCSAQETVSATDHGHVFALFTSRAAVSLNTAYQISTTSLVLVEAADSGWRRYDHNRILLFTNRQQVFDGSIEGFVITVPDLTEPYWYEQQDQRINHPQALFPFRQITAPAPPRFPWYFWKDSDKRLEPEGDFRVIDHAARLYPFRQRAILISPQPYLIYYKRSRFEPEEIYSVHRKDRFSLVSSFRQVPTYTSEHVRCRAHRRGWFGNRIIEVGDLITLTTPVEYTPYWMTLVDTPPADWLPLLEVFDADIDRNILRPSVQTEVLEVLREDPGPYRG